MKSSKKFNTKSVGNTGVTENNMTTDADTGDGMCNRRTLAIAGVVLAVVLTIAVLAFLIPLTSSKSCKIISTKPNATTQRRVAGGDNNKALVEFGGYFELNSTAFVPLELESIESSGNTLKLFFECLTIELRFTLNVGNFNVDKTTLTLAFLNGRTCHDTQFPIVFNPRTERYDCHLERPSVCRTGDYVSKIITHGTLRIKRLGIELNGDSKKHEIGEWANKGVPCATYLLRGKEDMEVVQAVEPEVVVVNKEIKENVIVPQEVVVVAADTPQP